MALNIHEFELMVCIKNHDKNKFSKALKKLSYHLINYNKLMEYAIMNDEDEIFEELYYHFRFKSNDHLNLIICSMWNNNKKIFNTLINSIEESINGLKYLNLFPLAISANNAYMFNMIANKMAIENINVESLLVISIANNNNLFFDIYDRFKDFNINIDRVIYAAINKGQKDIVKFLINNLAVVDYNNILKLMIGNNHISSFKILYNRHKYEADHAMLLKMAKIYNNPDIFKIILMCPKKKLIFQYIKISWRNTE